LSAEIVVLPQIDLDQLLILLIVQLVVWDTLFIYSHKAC